MTACGRLVNDGLRLGPVNDGLRLGLANDDLPLGLANGGVRLGLAQRTTRGATSTSRALATSHGGLIGFEPQQDSIPRQRDLRKQDRAASLVVNSITICCAPTTRTIWRWWRSA
jgi:hypothetical protein